MISTICEVSTACITVGVDETSDPTPYVQRLDFAIVVVAASLLILLMIKGRLS